MKIDTYGVWSKVTPNIKTSSSNHPIKDPLHHLQKTT